MTKENATTQLVWYLICENSLKMSRHLYSSTNLQQSQLSLILALQKEKQLSLTFFYCQYARTDEVDKLRQDYHDGINILKIFMDATNEKMTAPVQVSFLNIRAFVQDVEVNCSVILTYLDLTSPCLSLFLTTLFYFLQEIKHKVPAMEAACNAASRTAQLLTKDTPQEEISQMMTVMASIKEQLSKVSLMSANNQMLKFDNLTIIY